jgi:hypothetical protein
VRERDSRYNESSFLNYSALVSFIGTSTATAKCMIDEGYSRPRDALYKSKKRTNDEGYGRYSPWEPPVRQQMKGAQNSINKTGVNAIGAQPRSAASSTKNARRAPSFMGGS